MTSIKELESLSRQASELLPHDPFLRSYIKRKTASSYDDFVEQLYDDMADAIISLQQDRHLYQKKEFGEDSISMALLTHLKALNYEAEHDPQHGGHCDLLVKSSVIKSEWIGEAKLWKGEKYIEGGLDQLLTRYSTGVPSENKGAILVYVKQENTKSKLDRWSEHLKTVSSQKNIDLDSDVHPLRFDTTHQHPGSGLDYFVKHFFVMLNHATSIEPDYDKEGNEI